MEAVYRQIIIIKAQYEEIEAKNANKKKAEEEELEIDAQIIKKGESEDGDFDLPDQDGNDNDQHLNFEQSGGVDDYESDGRRDTLMMASGRSASYNSASSGTLNKKGKSLLDDQEMKKKMRIQSEKGKGFCGTPEDACCTIF